MSRATSLAVNVELKHTFIVSLHNTACTVLKPSRRERHSAYGASAYHVFSISYDKLISNLCVCCVTCRKCRPSKSAERAGVSTSIRKHTLIHFTLRRRNYRPDPYYSHIYNIILIKYMIKYMRSTISRKRAVDLICNGVRSHPEVI